VLLCAPFIKERVLARLFDALPAKVPVRVVTRWHPAEVRSGATDLAVLDVVAAREGAELTLLDTLHAKAYAVDNTALIGSANLTARALGWRMPANVEMLVPISVEDAAFLRLEDDLRSCRPATEEERARIQKEAEAIERDDAEIENDIAPGDAPEPWLPTMSAPEQLFDAYAARRDTLPSGAREATERDLDAMAIAANLDRPAFDRAVAEALERLPGPALLLDRVAHDGLLDDEAVRLVATLVGNRIIPHARRWEIMRDWISVFLGNRYEVTAETFVTRRRTGTRAR
jgi:hypothetical protein